MRRKGFLCFGCRTSQNARDLLDFERKKIKIKEIEMSYIKFFENNQNYFFELAIRCRVHLIEYSQQAGEEVGT